MKSKSLILIAIALGCGLVASIGISQVMGRSGTETEVVQEAEMVKILVATKDLSIGDELTAENVMLKSWPEEHLPEGFISDIDEVKTKYPNARLTKGSPIQHSSLMNERVHMIIPEGFRVIPIKVAADVVSNLVSPGDHIDIVVLLTARGDVSEAMATTVLRDVTIFDVNGQVERVVEASGNTINVKTVSLLLKPRDVNLIALADSMGKLRLSLRRPPGDGEVIEEDMDTTIRFGDVLSPDRRRDNSTLTDGLDHLANDPATSAVPVDVQPITTPPLVAPVTVEPPQPPAFEMLVRGPGAVTRYVWHDESQWPMIEPMNNGSPKPVTLQPLPTTRDTAVGVEPVKSAPLKTPAAKTPSFTGGAGEHEGDDNTRGELPLD